MSRDTKTESSLKNLLGPAEPLDFAARFAGVRPGAVPSTPIVWPTDQHAPNQISQIKSISPAQTTFAIPTNQPGRPVVPSKTTPNMVSNVRVTTKQISTPTGTRKQVTVAFTHPPNDPYFAGANIYLHKSGAEPVLVASGAKSPLQFVTDASSVPHAVHVTSVGNQGETDVMKSPAAPLSLQVTKSGGGVSSSSAGSSATGNLLQVNPTQTDPVTGAPIIQPVPPVKVIGGFPPPTKVSLDNLSDGGTTGRTKQTELINNTVMRVNDGTNIRTASQITGVVHSTSGAGAGVIDNAAVIHSRPEGIGTTVQKLNSSGLLVDADQVAADGATFVRNTITPASESIDNSNFEASTSILPPPSWASNGGTFAYETVSPFAGSQSIKITSAQFGGLFTSRMYAAQPGDTIFVSAAAKTDGFGGQADLLISWRKDPNTEISATDVTSSSASWTTLSLSAVAPAGTAGFKIFIRQTGAGTFSVWFDSVVASRVRSLDNEVADGTTHVRLLASHASNNVAYNFQGAWNSAANYVVADEVTFGNIYWIALANNTNSQPAVGNANWQAVGRIQGDIQIFTASGTWNKPAAGTFAMITVIGGGGGGGKGNLGSGVQGGGGGGGGGISILTLPLSILGATESVTVGTGGTGQSSGAATAGGVSKFGSWLLANGGNPGSTAGAGTGGTGNFGNGGNGGSGASPTNGFQGTGMAAGGGGSGGNEGTTLNGGNGGAGAPFNGTTLTGGAGGAFSSTGNASPGQSGTAPATNQNVGGPGAGGGGDTTHTGSSGGNGGTPTATCYGGGGGGGGSAPASSTVGNGGNGASGIVIVAVY